MGPARIFPGTCCPPPGWPRRPHLAGGGHRVAGAPQWPSFSVLTLSSPLAGPDVSSLTQLSQPLLARLWVAPRALPPPSGAPRRVSWEPLVSSARVGQPWDVRTWSPCAAAKQWGGRGTGRAAQGSWRCADVCPHRAVCDTAPARGSATAEQLSAKATVGPGRCGLGQGTRGTGWEGRNPPDAASFTAGSRAQVTPRPSARARVGPSGRAGGAVRQGEFAECPALECYVLTRPEPRCWRCRLALVQLSLSQRRPRPSDAQSREVSFG